MALAARSGATRVRVPSAGLHGRMRLRCVMALPPPPTISGAILGRARFLWAPLSTRDIRSTLVGRAAFLWTPGTASMHGRMTLVCNPTFRMAPAAMRSRMTIACSMQPPAQPVQITGALAGRMRIGWTLGLRATMRSAAVFRAVPKVRARMMSGGAFAWTRPAVFVNGYSYRARIVVPASSIKFTGALSFVMPIVETTQTQFCTVANGGLVQSSTGRDIRFETLAGVKLSHILDSYDPAAGKIVAWVRWPALTAGSDNSLYCYIGKAGLSASEADPAGAAADFLQWLNPLTGADQTGLTGRSLTPTSVATGDLSLGVAGDFDGSTSVAQAAPWAGFGGWSAITLDVWYKADTDAVGDTRNIFAQGPKTAPELHSISLIWRAHSSNDTTVLKVIQGNVTCGTTVTTQATAVSVANKQTANRTHVALRWSSGGNSGIPQIALNGVDVALSFTQGGTGTVAVKSGNLMLGDGPSTAALPGLKWKGLIGPVRLRASKISDLLLQTEHASQADPKSFYGFGGWDAAADSNLAPVAVPEPPFDVANNTATSLDVLANDFEPDGDTKSIATGSVTVPSHGTASISSGKVLYTPASGYDGTDSFNYAVSDPSGKRSTGKVRVTVAAAVSTTDDGWHPPLVGNYSGGTTAWESKMFQSHRTCSVMGTFGMGGKNAQGQTLMSSIKASNASASLGDWITAGRRVSLTVPLSADEIPLATRFTKITAGDYDNIYKKLCSDLKDLGCTNPIFRLGHEATNSGWPWSLNLDMNTANNDDTDNFKNWRAAWRHVSDVLHTALPNCLLDFCCFDECKITNPATGVQFYKHPDLWYPGDDYVDIISNDCYCPAAFYTGAGNTQINSATATKAQVKAFFDQGQHGPNDSYPRGPNTWYNYARSHNKRVSVPEWGVRNGKDCQWWIYWVWWYMLNDWAPHFTYNYYFNEGDAELVSNAGVESANYPKTIAMYKATFGGTAAVWTNKDLLP